MDSTVDLQVGRHSPPRTLAKDKFENPFSPATMGAAGGSGQSECNGAK